METEALREEITCPRSLSMSGAGIVLYKMQVSQLNRNHFSFSKIAILNCKLSLEGNGLSGYQITFN